MDKILYVIALILGLTISTRINAQEIIDLNISQGDLKLLKNLACTGDSSDAQLQASLTDIESLLNQSLMSYGLEITDEQLESLGAMATETQLQLESEEAVANFCSE